MFIRPPPVLLSPVKDKGLGKIVLRDLAFFSDLTFTALLRIFTYIEPIVHQRWAKTEEDGVKPSDHPQAELGFPTCDPSEARTTAVIKLMD